MGVPALFRWLDKKYPNMTQKVKEIRPRATGEFINTALPNPNRFEVDHLYLDMNGIIHPCCHPEDESLTPKNENEMFLAIFDYIDRIFNMIRPRKLLYFALDGVAPRAKMNQQRARRFRAAQEAAQKATTRQAMLDKATKHGSSHIESSDLAVFDSNAITPGTQFMADLKLVLEYYILKKLGQDPGWKYLQVILSDSSVPGEGEHKIMDFIRHQKISPHYSPESVHVIYGLDADLIMLALATHEQHFYILREDVFYKESLKRKSCEKCGKPFHTKTKCFLSAQEAAESLKWAHQTPFILLNVALLRDHLRAEFSQVIKTFHLSFERIIDDWIFLIFFVGNDFLPHLPSLEIREGAIDRLVQLYKDEFLIKRAPLAHSDPSKEACYLTKHGEVNLQAVKTIMAQIGLVEDEIFKQRKERHDREERKGRAVSRRVPPPTVNPSAFKPVSFVKSNQKITEDSRKPVVNSHREAIENNLKAMLNLPIAPVPSKPVASKAESIEGLLKSVLGLSLADSPNTHTAVVEPPAGFFDVTDDNEALIDIMHPIEDPEEEEEEALLDDVRLWESGYRERYYSMKFHIKQDEQEQLQFRRALVEHYMQGLAWVLQYYYSGCPSWDWYYPFHYAPFASDFHLSPMVRPHTFHLGEPFRPFEQLLSVLPAASSSLLPKCYAELMHEKESEILEFYPLDFSIDLNGARQPWKAVILLPFIDSSRLVHAAKKKNHRLNAVEAMRNTFGENIFYIATRHPLSQLMAYIDQPTVMSRRPDSSAPMKPTQIAHHDQQQQHYKNDSKKSWMNPPLFQGIDGALSAYAEAVIPGATYNCKLKTLNLPPLLGIKSWSAIYHVPFDRKKVVFKSLEDEQQDSRHFYMNPKIPSMPQRKAAALKGLSQSMAAPPQTGTKSFMPTEPLQYQLLTKKK